MEDPRDGDTRDVHSITTHGKPVTLVGPGGRKVYHGRMMSHTRPAGERYCPTHGWVPYEGILGDLFCPACDTSHD